MTTDISLVAQVAMFGNKRAFDELVRRYQSPVRRFFLSQTLGDSQLSDDLAQDTFIKAYTNIRSFRGLASFQTWLMRIAYNVFYDHCRKMRNEKLEMSNDRTEELERQMYELLIDKLTAAGYEHYEISNFAKPGYCSRHNSSYWHDVPYIGLGAAAHSYYGTCRQWNVADIHQYIEAIERGETAYEQEHLDPDTRYNDRITVALRTSEGLDLTALPARHRAYCIHEAQRFLDDGLLSLRDNHLVLTRKGLFVSDYIMSSLVIV